LTAQLTLAKNGSRSNQNSVRISKSETINTNNRIIMTKNKFSSLIDSRLGAYAALATVALATPVAAHADIVYSGLLNTSIPNNFDGIYLNFVTGATGSTGASVPGANWNAYNNGVGLSFYWMGASGAGGVSLTGTTYATLAANDLISAGSTYIAFTTTASMPLWRSGADAYLGVRFINSATSAINYGWVHLTTAGATGFPATIVDYAYENTGASILAGQVAPVPEPSTYALLGTLAAGAFAVRRWRKHQNA
jgi:hypothetical protein